MFRNYLKIAWRHLRKSRVYAFINIAGLASGMTAAFLIGLWVWDEITFDTYHRHYDRLAQVMVNQTSEGEIYTGSTIAMPVGEALRLHYRDNFRRISLVSFSGDDLVSIGTKRVTAKGIWAQADFPDMFTLEMIKGSRDALKDPSAMMISESLAKNLFGNEDPMNRVIRIVNRFDMKVAGVYRDLPPNTTFAGTVMLLAWDNPQNSYLNTNKDWVDHNGQLFVELADGVSAEQATAKIRNLPTPHVKGWHEEVMVYPMNKLHLWGDFSNGKATGGLILFVRLFIIVACFILLLACINFMNLSTARSEKRAKEVGIRKTMGSGRTQLVRQFLSESLLTALLAFLFATVLTLLFLPFFNRLSGKAIVIPWGNPVFWCIALGFTLFTGIVAGSYPAFYLSGFRPVKVLKGIFKAGPYAAIPRQVLVVLQF
ncbi:MAG TPA: ABC transporter permease, partial [Puia sp.]|nr:ABC transporter permease [Puia sp.]